jgi:hypothetical protein
MQADEWIEKIKDLGVAENLTAFNSGAKVQLSKLGKRGTHPTESIRLGKTPPSGCPLPLAQLAQPDARQLQLEVSFPAAATNPSLSTNITTSPAATQNKDERTHIHRKAQRIDIKKCLEAIERLFWPAIGANQCDGGA